MSEYKVALDIGSTTVKLIVLDSNENLIYSKYTRHFSDIQTSIAKVLLEAKEELGDIKFKTAITGSGGLNISNWLGVPFVQEVIAVAKAIEKHMPQCNVAIEIGGEDAKIIYFNNGVEQRMNGICAGGTGAFIDQMASLLQTDAEGLNNLAKEYNTIYPIAARCGVFAKTDIQPLINEGAAKEDLSISIFQAVVSQTISGLAQGMPIKGNVAFLGGPLHFLTELKSRFVDVLGLKEEEVLSPENSHLYAAFGSAYSIKDSGKIQDFNILLHNLEHNKILNHEIARLEPLFNTPKDYEEFLDRHNKNSVIRKSLADYKGNAFLGIDAGSTTTKMALISEKGELLYSFYTNNLGNPLQVIRTELKNIYEQLPSDVKIVNSCVTGYGENLIKEAIRIDIGEIETVAHYKAAAFFAPDVDFILDIGGQDMKCIRIKNGVIDNILLNEACSAGCGSFIETFAVAIGSTAPEFSKIAVKSKAPIDLGSRCTVFMNSRVKQAQKEGAEVSDISAGLAYSVIKNALQKVIKITEPKEMGKKLVVQGGTFYNDAVLRSFEIISEREAVRPDIAGIMGAFGSALIARERFEENYKTNICTSKELDDLEIKTRTARCKACENNCMLTINIFNGDRRHISGNRCENGLNFAKNKKIKESKIPNLFKYKYDRIFDYKSLDEKEAPRGVVGMPRVLNMYENYPFWHTFFTELGFSVKLSPKSTRNLYEKGIESMPSESVCYPAKLAHGHIMSLIEDGIKFIFYPSIVYEQKEIEDSDFNYNCPIVTSYPENIKNNVEEIKNIKFRNPFLNLNSKKSLIENLSKEFSDIPKEEIIKAIDLGFKEDINFKNDIKQKGEEAIKYIHENNIKGIILAGRPYHIDPEINHGIPELIIGYNMAVLTEDSVSHLGEDKIQRPLGVRDQWSYHARLYTAATFAQTEKNIELVQLTSFGCGLDAVTSDEVQEIINNAGKVYTLLKIDEINNLGSVRIRIRSLIAAMEERDRVGIKLEKPEELPERVVFTKEMKKDHTILCPQMSPIHFELIEPVFKYSGFNIKVLHETTNECIDIGLKYVNNDACYPAIITVGQLMKALLSGEYDLENTSVIISQTGGGCRASNYIGFIRKALKKANLSHIPVISISATGLEKNPGFKLSLPLANRAIQGALYGDLFQKVVYAIRPYEKEKGSANKLHEKFKNIVIEDLKKGNLNIFKKNVQDIVKAFDELPIFEDLKKPKVGVVGEILVKYHPVANNNVVKVLENEGAEVVAPGLIDFFLYCFYNSTFKHEQLGFKYSGKFTADMGIRIIEMYRKPMTDALRESKRFLPPVPIEKIAEYAEPIVSIGNQTGEGWFLSGEMVSLLEHGTNNIICTQPFACLPNHVVGKGIIKELKNRYPLSNIVAIDYDPGASEVNQLNRIKLMLSVAETNLEKEILQ